MKRTYLAILFTLFAALLIAGCSAQGSTVGRLPSGTPAAGSETPAVGETPAAPRVCHVEVGDKTYDVNGGETKKFDIDGGELTVTVNADCSSSSSTFVASTPVPPAIPSPQPPYTVTVVVILTTPTDAPAPATATPAPDSTPTPESDGTMTDETDECTLPADEAGMPAHLAAKFGGTAEQWRQKIDQATGMKLCAWEFLSKNRELGVGPNVVLKYSTGATGTVSYGVRNASATAWMAAYLVGEGDYTVAQVGNSAAVAIDTATWVPGKATADQIAARTPGSAPAAPSASPTPAARPTSAATINEAQLEALTSGPARYWKWITEGDKAHWEFKSGEALHALTLAENLPAGVYISFGKETSPGKWEEARITRKGESTPPLNQASFVTP